MIVISIEIHNNGVANLGLELVPQNEYTTRMLYHILHKPEWESCMSVGL